MNSPEWPVAGASLGTQSATTTRLPVSLRSRGIELAMIVRWCVGVMGEQSKISMQEPRGKISDSKNGNSGNRGRNRGLTRAGRRRQSRSAVDAADLRSDDQLAPSVKIGTGYARSLPPRAFE